MGEQMPKKRCLMIGAGGFAGAWVRHFLPCFRDCLEVAAGVGPDPGKDRLADVASPCYFVNHDILAGHVRGLDEGRDQREDRVRTGQAV
jgi:hypothetical protein